MFKALGIVVGLYVIYATQKGEVFAKSGVWGRTIKRDESPKYFWTIITIYAVLSLMLFFVF